MKKYDLQLRAPPSQQKKQPTWPALPPLVGFRDDDGDDYSVESEIAPQSVKDRALKEIEEQHRKALEEDPSIFDYDDVYDDTKKGRDIKCADIPVDTSGPVKLADFGLAKPTKMKDAKSSEGTAFWMAPEIVNLKNRSYGLAADIWSLGCTVLEMLTRGPPYSHLFGNVPDK